MALKINGLPSPIAALGFASCSKLLGLFAKNPQDHFTEEQKQMMTGLHNSCVEESGTTDDLIAACNKGSFADDKKLKCYMKCLMTTIGVMDDDGEIDFEAYVDLLPEGLQEMAKKVKAKCKDAGKSVTDQCEKAFLLNKCNYEVVPEDYFLV